MKLKPLKLIRLKKLPPLKIVKTVPIPAKTKKSVQNTTKTKLKPFKLTKKIPAKPTMQWYVLSVNMNYSDTKCRKQLRDLKKLPDFKKLIGRIAIPAKYEETRYKNVVDEEGNETGAVEESTVNRTRYPGYVVFECILTPEVRAEINGLKSVFCILMKPFHEVALSTEDEANLYLEKDRVKTKPAKVVDTPPPEGVETTPNLEPETVPQFVTPTIIYPRVAEQVRVSDKLSSMYGYEGKVLGVCPNGMCQVEMKVMGRLTTVSWRPEQLKIL